MQILKLLLSVAGIGSLLLLNGCMIDKVVGHGPQVKGSGTVKTETRKVAAFTKVGSAGSFDVDVKIGKTQSLTLSGEDNILPLIRTEVKNGELVIDTKDSYRSSKPVKVTIVVPSLSALSIAGSGDSTISGLNEKSLTLSIAGSGSIVASGKATSLSASIAGSGDIDASKLPSETATVDIAGSGDVQIQPIRSLKASIAGSGDIVYTPREGLSVTKSIVGSGSVRSR